RRGLFAFGRFCKVARYVDTPSLRQCGKCWSFDHRTHKCKAQVACRICAQAHTADDHCCPSCPPPTNRLGCQHLPVQCQNCGGTHT
ncbi:hypothetical protein SISNIDRAFT_396344, partial [Sistotremastrum niveocremeum HHB9708]